MSDRELLELAAKAAGHPEGFGCHCYYFDHGVFYVNGKVWNPSKTTNPP